MKYMNSMIEMPIVKRILFSILIGICVTGFVGEYAKKTSADISNSVIRLHILANSNTDYDQKLKLKVRDRVILYLGNKLSSAESTAETKEILQGELENIKTVCADEIKLNGYDYTVDAVIGNFDFPTKKYGDSSFPAGKYDALRILIGEAKGDNWWCVLYPQLCFINNSNGVLPFESRQKLKNVLTDDEYDIITSENGQMPVKIKFKILELFGK